MNRLRLSTLVLALVAGRPHFVAAQHPAMPPGMSHEEHLSQMRKEAELKARGAAAMGFDQDAAVHHFRLTADGGEIEVSAISPSDGEMREAIRSHLRQIARAFADGAFDAPFATHGEVPPGATTLQRLRSNVTYAFDETPGGGRVRIATGNGEALAAIHDFLRYQIREHHSGDPLDVSKPSGARR